jgi:hypothetical protein
VRRFWRLNRIAHFVWSGLTLLTQAAQSSQFTTTVINAEVLGALSVEPATQRFHGTSPVMKHPVGNSGLRVTCLNTIARILIVVGGKRAHQGVRVSPMGKTPDGVPLKGTPKGLTGDLGGGLSSVPSEALIHKGANATTKIQRAKVQRWWLQPSGCC